MLHVGCKQIRLYVYTTMCLHHVPWYAKRATGIQTVASSEPEVYKPGAGNHWRVVCVGAVPLKPSNHAITLHFVTQFNLRKETLFRGLKIGLCSRTFVALNLESVGFLIIKTGHTTMSITQQQGSHPAALYTLFKTRLWCTCTFKPNKEVPLGAKYYIMDNLRWSILPRYQFRFECFINSSADNTVSVSKLTPFRCSGSWLTFTQVINRAENQDILFLSKCGCLSFTRRFLWTAVGK